MILCFWFTIILVYGKVKISLLHNGFSACLVFSPVLDVDAIGGFLRQNVTLKVVKVSTF